MPLWFQTFLAQLPQPRWLAALFLLCVLPAGLGCALLTPVNMVADEQQHMLRADGLRYGEILGWWPPGTAPGALVNGAMVRIVMAQEYIQALPDQPVPPPARQAAEAIGWGPDEVFFPTQMVNYFPVYYAPAALALLAGQAAGLTPLHTYILGRAAMLLSFAALGAAALALARTGGVLLFALLSLPMAVNLAASYNQDGLLIASCTLAAALLTGERHGPGPRWFAALLLLGAAGTVKLPYAPLLLLCLLPLNAPGLKWRALGVLAAFAGPALWLLHLRHAGIYPWPHSPYQPGPLWPGDRNVWLHEAIPADNLRALAAHPAALFWLPVASLWLHWPLIWRTILGSVSVCNILLPAWEYWLLAPALAVAALGALRGSVAGWRRGDVLLALLACYGVFMAVELSLYVTFTPAGNTAIDGVQGRYFLPVLAFAALLLPVAARLPGARRLAVVPEGWFCLPALAMALVNIYALPAFIFHLFKMPGP